MAGSEQSAAGRYRPEAWINSMNNGLQRIGVQHERNPLQARP